MEIKIDSKELDGLKENLYEKERLLKKYKGELERLYASNETAIVAIVDRVLQTIQAWDGIGYFALTDRLISIVREEIGIDHRDSLRDRIDNLESEKEKAAVKMSTMITEREKVIVHLEDYFEHEKADRALQAFALIQTIRDIYGLNEEKEETIKI